MALTRHGDTGGLLSTGHQGLGAPARGRNSPEACAAGATRGEHDFSPVCGPVEIRYEALIKGETPRFSGCSRLCQSQKINVPGARGGRYANEGETSTVGREGGVPVAPRFGRR